MEGNVGRIGGGIRWREMVEMLVLEMGLALVEGAGAQMVEALVGGLGGGIWWRRWWMDLVE
jgi:hypothetical protein